MHKLLYILIFSLLINFYLYAAPASPNVRTFTQADGTTFQGVLKGTSAFHWIQSNGQIVKYNYKDKFYHIAIFDKNNTLILTNKVPKYQKRNLMQNHTLKKEEMKKLKTLYNKISNQHQAR